MKNTFKKLLLCFLAAAAVITGSAAVKDMGDAEKVEPGKSLNIAAASKPGYCLRDWQGYIAVFEDGRQTPKTVTDIPTETLNNVDREKLRTGIEAGTREELLSLLEDLSS